MLRRLNQFLLLFLILVVVLTSAVRTTVVHADDGVTEPPTAESTPPPVDEAPPTAEPVPATEVPEPAAAEPAAEEPAAVVEVLEQPPAAEEMITVSEILEQLPEDTALVVVNAAGEVEPLASEEAAEIVATGDPMWCPAPATPGDATCTGSHSSFGALIQDLIDHPTTYTGAGIIWVAYDYDSAQDNSPIVFDGSDLLNLSSSNLTIRGGWSGGNNTTVDPATPSTSDVSMAVINWQGNITIQNLQITSPTDNQGYGLLVDTTGNITLDNVSVANTAGVSSQPAVGAELLSTGNTVIINSRFDHNDGFGLLAVSGGTIMATNVSASNNTLTGAYLDSCQLGALDPGLCAGNGTVTLTGNNLFNDNGIGQDAYGLLIDSGGGITISNVQANNNSFGGAFLRSADQDGTGNVLVTGSDFNDNTNGTGLEIFTGQNIRLLDVYTLSNKMGAVLDTTYGAGTIYIEDSSFGMLGSGNAWTGLHATSGSTITIMAMESSGNGVNGAYLEAEGNMSIGATFNQNMQSGTGFAGLYAWSNGGNITLTGSAASGNGVGAGAVLGTSGTGTITVNGGFFNQNGTFGIQAGSDDGDIELSGVTASFNQVKGAYLGAFWAGNIGIFNSTFVENGSYGIYAFTNEGDIDLDNVYVFGSDGGVGPGADDLTDYGAILAAGGDVTVIDSTIELNTDIGLGIVSGGQVDLSNVVSDSNGGNGVEVYTLTTGGPICAGEPPVNIVVTVNAGAYTNNGGYGLLVKPGPGGTVTFLNPSTFGGNILGDYLIDLSQEFKDCTPASSEEEKPGDDGKGPLIVDVPETGGPTVEQDCEQYTGTILRLPDGTSVKIDCPFEGFSKLEAVPEAGLPGSLSVGLNYAGGIDFSLSDGQGNLILNEDGTITFVIPADMLGRAYSILFWDPALNEGKGGWVELPPYEVGTHFPLHPEDAGDQRTVLSGVRKIGNTVTATVDFPGIFVLIAK